MPDIVAILRNPHSGTGRNKRLLLALIARLRSHNLTPRLFSSRHRLQRKFDIEDFRSRLRCVVAAGGDGTVADVVARYPGVPVAVLAMGTENVLAKYLKLPRTGAGVANMIATGATRRIDVGVLSDRKFTIMATAGLDANVIHQVHALRRGNLRKWKYLQPILTSLRTYEYPEIRVYCDDAEQPICCRQAMIFNLPTYAMKVPFANSASGDDGYFDLRLFERGGSWQMLHYLWDVVRKRHEQLPHVRCLRAKRVRLESDTPVPLQTDGDPAGYTPAEVFLQPEQLELIVPETEIVELHRQEGPCQTTP